MENSPNNVTLWPFLTDDLHINMSTSFKCVAEADTDVKVEAHAEAKAEREPKAEIQARAKPQAGT